MAPFAGKFHHFCLYVGLEHPKRQLTFSFWLTYLCSPSSYSYIFPSHDSAEGTRGPILAYISYPWHDSWPCTEGGREMGKHRVRLLHIHNSICNQPLSQSFQNVSIYTLCSPRLPDCSTEEATFQALESLDLNLNPQSLTHLGIWCNLSVFHLKMGLIWVHTSQSCGDQTRRCLSRAWHAIKVRC